MIKYTVVPRDGVAYDTPIYGEETTYHVRKQGDQDVQLIDVVIRLYVDDWAPNDVIRVEGFMRTQEGLCGVIGYYRLHSLEPDLGILEVQDA